MLNVAKMVKSARACLGWPYVSPGTNDSRGIDCSGLLVKVFRDQGASIYHGSNTIWRKYCTEKGELKKESQLEVGMAVFKWNPNTPAKFNDGQGDFQHVGLVTKVNPLEIVEASSVSKKVITNSKIGKWRFWGRLKGVDYGKAAPAEEPAETAPETPAETTDGAETPAEEQPLTMTATVWAENGKPVKLRARKSTICGLYDELPVGTEVKVTRYGSQWSQITYRNRKGWWMMSKFLTFG